MLIIGIIGIIVFLLVYIKVNTTNQNNSPSIPNPKIETHDEWFQTERKWDDNKYIPSERIDYSEENREKLKNSKSNELEFKRGGVKIEGKPMIKRKYTFYGLNGLGRGQHPEYEPTDLAPFAKNPFD